MANRIRNERLEIKLTKEEKALFEEKRKLARCRNMSHFIRKCVLEKEIYQIDLEPFRDLQGLLSNATNNINQIAKRVNSTGVIYKEDIGDMKKEIEHSSSKSTMEDLYKICKNHGIYIGNGNGEIIFLSSFFLLDYANKKTPMYPLRPHQP